VRDAEVAEAQAKLTVKLGRITPLSARVKGLPTYLTPEEKRMLRQAIEAELAARRRKQ